MFWTFIIIYQIFFHKYLNSMNFSCRSLRIHAASEWDCTAPIRATAAVAAQLHFLLPCSENSTTALAEAMPAVSRNPCKKKCNLHILHTLAEKSLLTISAKPERNLRPSKNEPKLSKLTACAASQHKTIIVASRGNKMKKTNMSGWALLRSTGGKH